MRIAERMGAALLLAALLAGCGSDDPAAPEPEEITGLWSATCCG